MSIAQVTAATGTRTGKCRKVKHPMDEKRAMNAAVSGAIEEAHAHTLDALGALAEAVMAASTSLEARKRILEQQLTECDRVSRDLEEGSILVGDTAQTERASKKDQRALAIVLPLPPSPPGAISSRRRKPGAAHGSSCMQRLIVCELRSYLPEERDVIMLHTVATAKIAEAINATRIYAGARVLSLTSLQHDSYIPGSRQCTYLCVMRWCGPSNMVWVASDLEAKTGSGTRGPIPDTLLSDFYRTDVGRAMWGGGLSGDTSWLTHTCTQQPFFITAVSPTLVDSVEVCHDGSIRPRCLHTQKQRDEAEQRYQDALAAAVKACNDAQQGKQNKPHDDGDNNGDGGHAGTNDESRRRMFDLAKAAFVHGTGCTCHETDKAHCETSTSAARLLQSISLASHAAARDTLHGAPIPACRMCHTVWESAERLIEPPSRACYAKPSKTTRATAPSVAVSPKSGSTITWTPALDTVHRQQKQKQPLAKRQTQPPKEIERPTIAGPCDATERPEQSAPADSAPLDVGSNSSTNVRCFQPRIQMGEGIYRKASGNRESRTHTNLFHIHKIMTMQDRFDSGRPMRQQRRLSRKPSPVGPNVGQAPTTEKTAIAAPVEHVSAAPRCARQDCLERVRAGHTVSLECTAKCSLVFHRKCWTDMGLSFAPAAIDAATVSSRGGVPCPTPDCWGVWARVSLVQRGPDGVEMRPKVKWSRSDADSHSSTLRQASPPVTQPEDTIAAQAPLNSGEAYVGRIRRRRTRQDMDGPPHRRIDPMRQRSLVPPAKDNSSSSPQQQSGARAPLSEPASTAKVQPQGRRPESAAKPQKTNETVAETPKRARTPPPGFEQTQCHLMMSAEGHKRPRSPRSALQSATPQPAQKRSKQPAVDVDVMGLVSAVLRVQQKRLSPTKKAESPLVDKKARSPEQSARSPLPWPVPCVQQQQHQRQEQERLNVTTAPTDERCMLTLWESFFEWQSTPVGLLNARHCVC